jgi:hemerythrin-like domain-containing protein
MGTLSPNFSADTLKIHDEHQALIVDLAAFTRALDALDCNAGAYADLYGIDRVSAFSRRLIDALPEHFDREENTVLFPVAQISPELAQLVNELRKEHDTLRLELSAFSLAVDELESSDDLYGAIWQVKEMGKNLAQQISRHVALEERELAGFL